MKTICYLRAQVSAQNDNTKALLGNFSMLKIILFLCLIIACAGQANSQQLFIKQFEKTYGSVEAESFGELKQTADGGFIIIGRTNANPANGTDVYVIKTDATGNEMWSKTYGGAGSETGENVVQTADGGFAFVGFTNSFGHGSNDGYLIRTDANGDTLWTRTFGCASSDLLLSIKQTRDGGFILSGITSCFGAVANAAYLVKTDANGNLQWQKAIDIQTWECAYDAIQTFDGGYMVTGYSIGVGSIFLLKTDSVGETEWMNYSYTDNYWCLAHAVIQTPDSGYVVVGNINGYGNGAFDIIMLKTNSTGSLLWKKTYGGIMDDFGSSVMQLNDGGFLIGGETQNWGAGNSDLLFIRTDENGNEIRKGTAGGPAEDGGGGRWYYVTALQLADQGYVLAGMTKSFGAGLSDIYVTKLFEFSDLTPTIAGRVYNDVDSNCIYNDTIDYIISNRMIQLTEGPYYAYTGNDGNYYLRVPDGNYQLEQTPVANDIFKGLECPSVPLSYNVNISEGNLVPGKDFTDVLENRACSVNVSITPTYPSPLVAPCPGIEQKYCIEFVNSGTAISHAQLALTVDNNVTITGVTVDCPGWSASPPDGQTVIFSGTVSSGNQTCNLCVTVQVPILCDEPPILPCVTLYPPTILTTSAILTGNCGGDSVAFFAVPLEESVTCALDPNDKLLVTPKGCGPFGNISGDETLTYRVRFQNTGNAPAHNVVLKDVLDADLDLSTLKVIASSHPGIRTELFPANTLIFSYIGIELPDSGADYEGSNGYVIFSIRPKSNLPDGTTITNEVAIYFDLNEPVITNSTYNTIRDVLQPVTLPAFDDVCINDSSFALEGGQPEGGVYSGNGVNNGVFSPSEAGSGIHAITYSYAAEITENNYFLNTNGAYSPVAGDGTKVILGDDQVGGPFPIGFGFDFYGSSYSELYISSNGFITFNANSTHGCCSGAFLPHFQSNPSNLISIAWSDLYPPGNGFVEYFTTGIAPDRKLIVNFTDIPQCCNAVPKVTAQVILYEGSNIIEIHSTFVEVNAGTMGIVNNGGTLATAVPGRNSSFFSITNDFVQFIPPSPLSECSNSAKNAISVKPLPTAYIAASGPTTFCEGNSVVLSAVTTATSATYQWSSGEHSSSIEVISTGEYRVTVSNDCGSAVSEPVTITVNPKPAAVITASGNTNLCPGDDVILLASAGDSYLWSSGATTQSITVSETGTYTVTVTSNGCSAVSEPMTVTVNNYPCGKDKLLICHIPPGNPENPHTICIKKNALEAHKAHGDYCGPCNDDAKDVNSKQNWCGWSNTDFINYPILNK
ncbi:MAG: hypothetical protein KKD31_00390, partial [Bacteroidetes bacterium]|nr:hypothetical protein [Bacteroidota bacterium]